MSDSTLRLPSIAELVKGASAACPPAHRPSYAWAPLRAPTGPPPPAPAPAAAAAPRAAVGGGDVGEAGGASGAGNARYTPLAASPLQPPNGVVNAPPRPSASTSSSWSSSWKAVNHLPRQHQHQHHQEQQRPHASSTASTSTASALSPFTPNSHEFAVNHYCPPRKAPLHPEATTTSAGPITPRQDSAVSETTPQASSPSTIPKPPADFPPRLLEKHDLSLFHRARAAVGYPNTPPSPAPSPESDPAPTAHEHSRTSPPAASTSGASGEQLALWRVYDSNPNPSPLSRSVEIMPRRTRVNHRPYSSSSMPPPPSPVSIMSASAPSMRTVARDSVSTHSSTGPSQQQPVAPSSPSGADHDYTSTASLPRHSPPPARPSNHSNSPRCHYCNEVWEYEYPRHNHDTTPSDNVNYHAMRVDSLNNIFQETMKKANEQFEKWKRRHLIEPGEEDMSVPCLASQEGRPRSSESSKRKADVLEEPHIASKFRRLSCESSTETQLTPPPETSQQKKKVPITMASGEVIDVEVQVAALLKVSGVPPFCDPLYNDAEHMFGRARSRSNRGQSREKSSSPAKQPAPSHQEKSVAADS
ncbi:hypothetical protein P280DRAFT_465497 [Massarina eburnea CBS 473.64]|uniref:Uncharacterized protein n=1 Tax=Massarina eburnea CBS 473.64 TaxID=1395130 RepID=A0A6A6SD09_9PLEO|nr:hypothetical protein P280DRAFT_465497 [Massarina eburnea CBS 473.64]